MFSYKQADESLQGRNYESRKLANNTYLIRGDNVFHVKLHATNVVTIHDNGLYTLDSGGWLTATTKDRINRFSPARISQSKSVWYLSDGSLFNDGMKVNGDGLPVDPVDPKEYEKQLKEIKKQAKAYAKKFVSSIEKNGINPPSSGDCWHCTMKTEDGQTLGDKAGDHNHIRYHIEENYYVPSLLYNAMKEGGYDEQQVRYFWGSTLVNPERHIYKYIVKRLRQEIEV